ncbi:MAG: glycine-rich protein [Kofleriaceae bacterium]|nr:glycine-rich protein [Kofleriaceae bacterium]
MKSTPDAAADAFPDAAPVPGSLQVTIAADAETTEAGGMATFTVRLSRAPSANVTVPLTSSDVGEGTVSPASLTFTPTTWDQPQTVTVVGADDAERDGLVSYNVTLGNTTSTDAGFTGLTATAALRNVDNEIPGVTVSAASGMTAEDGTTATFTVVLDVPPLADVTIPVSSPDTGEIAADVAQLVFTTTNWSTPQTVTLTGIDDLVDDGNQTVGIDLGTIASTDTGYTALTLADVAVVNVDDDQLGVIVTSAAGPTAESGTTTTFTVVLTSEPVAGVTVTPTSSDTTEGTVGAALEFTAGNWNTPQTVTVTGQNDDIDDGDITFPINFPITSTDTGYAAYAVTPIQVTNTDDDTAGLSVTPLSSGTTEQGGVATFTVALTSEPTAPVTIPIASSLTTEGTLNKAELVFDASDWNTQQTVTVTGQNDNVIDGHAAYQILSSAPTTTDAVYELVAPFALDAINYEIADLTFDFTGAVQTFVVPPNVTTVTLNVLGAQGGANWVNNTNFGGRTAGTITVTPGETLSIYVGGQPTVGIEAGWNGGGAGDGAGKGGGGGSDVRQGGTALEHRVLVAGGGGGAGYWSNLHVIGGQGGGLVGGDGSRDGIYPGGRGATQTGGGADGTCINLFVVAMAGSLGQGGTPLGSNCGCEGYGGGGGYYGGAGSGNCRGGGGGSGFASPTATDVQSESGVRVGHGQVTLHYGP